MKKHIAVYSILTIFIINAFAQVPDSWTQKSDVGYISSNGPKERTNAVAFTIGSNGYVGIGFDGNFPKSDFWEFDPSSNTWSQKADFGGGPRYSAVGMSIGNKGYIGLGNGGYFGDQKDFWEYDPIANSWTAKADFITARTNAVGFAIGDKGYVGTGADTSGFRNDFWEYDPSIDTWTQKSDFAGKARIEAIGFSIQNLGYVGTGQDGNSTRKDFWEYNPATDTWDQKEDFAGGERQQAIGFSLGTKGYIGTGMQNPAYPLKNDFWEYDPANDSWIQKSSLNIGRYGATVFCISGKAYGGTGTASYLEGGTLNDFWEYNPINDIWTRKQNFGGLTRFPSVGFNIGNKGYVGLGDNGTMKKDFWEYDPQTNIWTQRADFVTGRNYAIGFSIGNKGYIGTGQSYDGPQNDFWEYDPAINKWTQKANVGSTGRYGAVGFSIGNKGYLGTGYDNNPLKDFWEYDPGTNIWTRKADFMGGNRVYSVGFRIGTKGYVVNGSDLTGNNDNGEIWEYDPQTDKWTQKNYFGGPRANTVGFGIGNSGFIGSFTGDTSYVIQLWEYIQSTDTWIQRKNFPGEARVYALGFSIGEKGYYGTGMDVNYNGFNDFWEYTRCVPPSIPSINSSSSNICGGQPVTLSIASGNLNDATEWKWYKDSLTGTSIGTGSSIIVSPKSSTKYFVRGEGGCVSPEKGNSILISELASITIAGDTMSTGNGVSYQWINCNNNSVIAGATSQTFTPAASGNYSVIVTDNNNCTDTSLCTSFTIPPPCIPPTNPSIVSSSAHTCGGKPITLSIGLGNLNSATHWQWYKDSFAGTPIGTGNSILVSPVSNTKYLVRGEGGCVSPANGDSITIVKLSSITISGSTMNASSSTFYQWINCNDKSVIAGATSQSFAPTVSGNYAVILTDNNNCSDTSQCVSITVTPPCIPPTIPTINSTSTHTCGGKPITLSIGSGNLNGATHWQWYKDSFTGTPIGTGNSILVSPVSNTKYLVRGEGGCVSPAKGDSITIVKLSSITISGSTMNASNSAYYQWMNCNNKSIIVGATSQSFTPTVSGNYAVILTDINNCSDTSQCVSIAVTTTCIPPTIPTINSTSNHTCGYSPITLSIGSGALNDATHWQWYKDSFTGTPIGTGNSIIVYPNSEIQFLVRGEGGCVSSSIGSSITISKLSTISISGSTMNASNGTFYQWINCNDNSLIPNATSQSYTPVTSGSYAVILSNHSNCTDTSQCTSINVTQPCIPPTISSIKSSSYHTCGAMPITLSIESGTLNDATNWQWYKGSFSGIPIGTGDSIVIFPSSETEYFVRGEGGCVSGFNGDSITIFKLTSVTISGNTMIASNGTAYQWIDCNTYTNIEGATNQSFTPTVSGNYSVLVTDNSNCSDSSMCTSFTIISSIINNTPKHNAISIFPNPNNGDFTIRSTSPEKLTIINSLGLVVKKVELNEANNFVVLLTEMDNGIYLIVNDSESHSSTYKIIVMK